MCSQKITTIVLELKYNRKLCSFVFHLADPSLLVIGGYGASLYLSRPKLIVLKEIFLLILHFFVLQYLVLWDTREKDAMTLNNAHDSLITALGASSGLGRSHQ